MFWWPLLVALLGVSAIPVPQSSSTTEPTSTACAQISRAVRSLLTSNPFVTPTFTASLAFDCLSSVPNRPQPAVKLVQSLKAFTQWQSTLTFLKAPPQSYMLPPIDIQGNLDNISATASAGEFSGEYDFQASILRTFLAAHDGHFLFIPDVFKVFTFSNPLLEDVVSVSSNGTSLPKLYHYSTFQASMSTTPVAIAKINGQDATSFLAGLGSVFGLAQDVDAQWNMMFSIYSNPSGGNPLSFFPLFLGPSLTLTYENGSTQTQQTVATLNPGVDFSNIASGDDFYDAFCNPGATTGTPTASSADLVPTKPGLKRRLPALTDYPPPVVQNSDEGTTMGFFVDGSGFEDVAVLAISAFAEETDPLYLFKFQEAVQSFLSQSRAAKKQRLVIDLTSNGGGIIIAGFELFAQLFPDIDPFNANNMRLTESLANISQILAAQPIQDQNAEVAVSGLLSNLSPLDLSDPQGDKFNTTDEILTPVTLQGDQFTAYIRQPAVAGFNLTGTGNRSNPPPALFKPENVVLLTDGTCGSTCTIFSYLMIFQANVTTISVGGRPQVGPMQSVGGVEGSQVLQFSEISNVSASAINLVSDQVQSEKLLSGELGVLAEGYAIQRSANPVTSPGSINFRNAFAPSDSKTPLQFLYEPANCRFFYTPQMINTPELVWKYAVGATWTDAAHFCVQGSRVQANTTRGLDPAFRAKNNGAEGNDGSTQTEGSEDNNEKPKSSAERGLKRGTTKGLWLPAIALATLLLF
ncbi:hypothetical protein F4821DRAFT_243894 [Hypoxylon rubiginosum]|uniref:Uncharacterized protein n=1 Tax=Hypoxylon rubiginosum TaxID=110542 RepID=A0ACC0CU18_9PEZI|nr:hypothetical protein F4821DRAFT_243894 [Hypoxylon rubiginosum]